MPSARIHEQNVPVTGRVKRQSKAHTKKMKVCCAAKLHRLPAVNCLCVRNARTP